MKVYHYDPQTLEYIGESEAPLDPLETDLQGEDVFLIPSYATTEPPTLEEGKLTKYINGWILEDVPIPQAPTLEEKIQEINNQVRLKIAEQYDYTQEIQMLNKGLINNTDEEYLAYIQYRQECVDWGITKKSLLGER